MFNLIGRKGLSKKSFLAFSLVDKSALIINFEGREAKGLSKARYDETFAGEDGEHWKMLLKGATKAKLIILLDAWLDKSNNL